MGTLFKQVYDIETKTLAMVELTKEEVAEVQQRQVEARAAIAIEQEQEQTVLDVQKTLQLILDRLTALEKGKEVAGLADSNSINP